MNIVELSETLYSASTQQQLTRQVVAVQQIEQVLEADSVQFLCYNLRNFDAGYCQSLMLTFHELWQDYSVTDWMALFRENVTRPTPQAFDPSGVWSDCVFFSAWLQLNPFPLLLEINAQLGGSAFLVARHFRINAPLLFPDKSDWEALDGKTFCDIALLEAARKKLLAQDSRLVRPYTNAEELKEYLTSLHDSGVFGPAP